MKKSILKKLLLAAMIPFMGIAFTACDDDEETPQVPKIEIFDGEEEIDAVYLDLEGSSKTVSVVSNNSWNLYSVYPDWIKVEPQHGGKGKTQVTISAEANNAVRSGELEFRMSSTRKVVLTVNQGITGPVKKTIAEIRAHYASEATAPVDGWYIEGVVVSDKEGANVQSYQIAIVDNTTVNSGVMINYKRDAGNPAFVVGDKVKVDLTNAAYNVYSGLLQLNDVLPADVTFISADNDVTPVSITAAQLKSGEYESMLVSIDDVERVDKTNSSLTMNGNINVKSGTETFVMRTGSSATFKNELAPMGKGKLIGIAGIFTPDYQVMPRNMTDVEDMQDATIKVFSVSPNTPQEPTASAGTLTFNVSSTVAWTVVSSDNTNFPVSINGGTGSEVVTVDYAENTSTTNTRTATITFETTDAGIAEADRKIVVAVTQAKKSSSGTAGTYTSKDGILPTEDDGTNKYYAHEVVVGGTTYKALKFGTSSVIGTYTTPAITSAAGNVVLSFYAVSWKDKAGELVVKVNNGGTIDGADTKTLTLTSNDGLANNSPYTIAFNDTTDYYEFTITGATAATTLTLSTTTGKTRCLVTGLNITQ